MSTSPPYPRDFLFGVATSAHQIEGGLNGDGEPRNNWAAWEERGKAHRSGESCRFWERWSADLDRAASLGVNAFRMGIEWARIEPKPGRIDAVAVHRYADILAGARRRGMRPVVTLHHFTHPEWLGVDAWLEPGMPLRFGHYCETAVQALNRRLEERHSQGPLDFFVTINEPNALALATYLARVFPHDQSGPRAFAAALANMLRGHVHAYRALHGLYEARGHKRPTVTMNTWACASYPNDRMLVDLLRPTTRGHLRALGTAWRAEVPFRGRGERLVDRFMSWALPPSAFQRVAEMLGPDEDVLDVLSFDYYDPWLSDYLSWRGLRIHPWQWLVRPERFVDFVRAYLGPHGGRDLYVLENGIAVRHDGHRAYPRPDGLTRDVALEQALSAVDSCLSLGLPVRGYFHWSLIDNYEWGSFEPRFGLFGIDYRRGAARLDTDAAGSPAAAAYRAGIAARRLRGARAR